MPLEIGKEHIFVPLAKNVELQTFLPADVETCHGGKFPKKRLGVVVKF